MIEAMAGAAVGALVTLAYRVIQGRTPPRPVVRRLEPISDAALTSILALFAERSAGDDSIAARRADGRFVDSICVALADKALTAAQIRRLFKHTYCVETETELKRLFGWDEALREAVVVAEEKAAQPPTPRTPLPLITDADFKTLKKELSASVGDDPRDVFERWNFSYTREQVAEVLGLHGGKSDNTALRASIRACMPLHQP